MDVKDIGPAIMRRVEKYYDEIESLGFAQLWKDCYNQYYRGFRTKGKIQFSGKQGQYRNVSVNHYRNILQNILTMTTSQRPAFEPRAINDDYESITQIGIAKNLLDYYLAQMGLEEYIVTAAEYAVCLGEGYLIDGWDPNLGKIYVEDETEEEGIKKKVGQKEGDIFYQNASPFDVARDIGAKSYRELNWVIVRSWVNKYDFASIYPEIKDDIEGMSYEIDERNLLFWNREVESDVVPIYTLYHKKTPVLPDGRIVTIIDEIVVRDTRVNYDNFPVKRISPNEIRGLAFGYTVGFDLFQPQRVIDMLESTIATNQDLFGKQNIAVPMGSGVSVEQLEDGLNLLMYDPDKGAPQALNLVSTPPEIFSNTDRMESKMEVISGVNSVRRGEPQKSLKSGAAIALVDSKAIEFNSWYEQSYNRFLEEIGTSLIDIFKTYADTPRLIAISGESEQWYMKEFKKQDLENIKRVIVNASNPLTRTIAGKQAMADTLAERGMIEDPAQYLQVIQTGRIEPLLKNKTSAMTLIKRENEQLSKGIVQKVVSIDNHPLHILENSTVLNYTGARDNPEILDATLQHLMAHITEWAAADQNLLASLGIPPYNPQLAGQAMQEAQGGTSNDRAQMPKQPQMPEQPQMAQVGDETPGP